MKRARLAAVAVCLALIAFAGLPSLALNEFEVTGTITVRDIAGNQLSKFDCKRAFTVAGITPDQKRHTAALNGCSYDLHWSKTDQTSKAITLWVFITPQYAQCSLQRTHFDQGNDVSGRAGVRLKKNVTVLVGCQQLP